MAYDDQDDLFVDDFDFIDEDEGDETAAAGAQQEQGDLAQEEAAEESESKATAKPKRRSSSRGGKRGSKQETAPEAQETVESQEASESQEADEPQETAKEKGTDKEKEAAPAEEPKEPAVPTDHVVHIYEYGKFTRTIAREFTSDDAEAFAVEFNRTSSAHSRHSIAAGRDDKPAEAL